MDRELFRGGLVLQAQVLRESQAGAKEELSPLHIPSEFAAARIGGT